MMPDNRNTILAVILSGFVLIAWQYFYNIPTMEKQRAAEQAQKQASQTTPAPGSSTTPTPAQQGGTPSAGAIPGGPAATPAVVQPRDTGGIL